MRQELANPVLEGWSSKLEDEAEEPEGGICRSTKDARIVRSDANFDDVD
jgi:hypothetical protein